MCRALCVNAANGIPSLHHLSQLGCTCLGPVGMLEIATICPNTSAWFPTHCTIGPAQAESRRNYSLMFGPIEVAKIVCSIF